jgi:hypothetical protein
MVRHAIGLAIAALVAVFGGGTGDSGYSLESPVVPATTVTSTHPSTMDSVPRLETFELPGGAGPHDVAPAVDGGVWFTAQRAGYLGYAALRHFWRRAGNFARKQGNVEPKVLDVDGRTIGPCLVGMATTDFCAADSGLAGITATGPGDCFGVLRRSIYPPQPHVYDHNAGLSHRSVGTEVRTWLMTLR